MRPGVVLWKRRMRSYASYLGVEAVPFAQANQKDPRHLRTNNHLVTDNGPGARQGVDGVVFFSMKFFLRA